MFDELVLLETENVKDEIGRVERRISKKITIPITVNSVGQNEHFMALSHNLKAFYKMETNKLNYNNQNFAIYQNREYIIYRTFLEGQKIYLYLAEKYEQS